MTTYNVSNEEYNVNFDLKLNSFHDFIESLKKSKEYYYDYCNLKNINIKDFDNEYIDNINILKGELLKYYILITNNDNVEEYVIIDDTIKELHKFMISELGRTTYYIFPEFENKYTDDENTNNEISEADVNFIETIDINFLTRNQLAKLINIYAYNCNRYLNFQKGFMTKMNIICILIPNSITKTLKQFDESLDNYLDSQSYETIYKRELDKILTNLPSICLSCISSKKLLNCNNDLNLIDLNNNEEYTKVD